jgi:protein O-GlcNAc transferase
MLNKTNTKLLYRLIHDKQVSCEWTDWADMTRVFNRTVLRDVKRNGAPAPSLTFLTLLPSSTLKRMAVAHSASLLADSQATCRAAEGCPIDGLDCASIARAFTESTRIKIAYIGSNFGHHPVGHLASKALQKHNREKFEVFVFANRADDGSSFYSNAKSAADHFFDVSEMSDEPLTQLVRKQQLHLVVDTNGWTEGHRASVLQSRVACVQLEWLGFASTTGLANVDYFVTDRVCNFRFLFLKLTLQISAPESIQTHFTEKLLYVPVSPFVNSYAIEHADLLKPSSLKRSDFGLPDDAFVFSCNNQLYKLDPDTFATWLQVLMSVPNAYLWLWEHPVVAKENLIKAAEELGVSDRIVFRTTIDESLHLASKQLADVVLDTPWFNGHTTTLEALWVGVPVLTLIQPETEDRMISRIAPSLLAAVGLYDELVATSQDDYLERAVRLATDREYFASVKEKLAPSVRSTLPLFDTDARFAELEGAFSQAWETYRSQFQ